MCFTEVKSLEAEEDGSENELKTLRVKSESSSDTECASSGQIFDG
jgi:hypothetical protein